MSTPTLLYIYQNRGKNIFVQNENCWAWVLVYESLFQLELFWLNLQFVFLSKLCLLEIVTKIRCNCSFVAKLSSEPSSKYEEAEGKKIWRSTILIGLSYYFYSLFYNAKNWGPGALCVQMDFTQTFQTNTKCDNINHVWSHVYKLLVVLKYHRSLWVNIFDTDISRCIHTYIILVYLTLFGVVMLLQMSVSKILTHMRLWYFKTTKSL